ncbi:hypothetical protein OUZ56_006679 [Daphnia magna]|uniref:Uncharacterized protein n=1 Tax=Daphnia magna TaxID=35525 RepID=A0ABQ9YWT5_9CRUS|nr:hypothetical protein OUZ56_006679 [Daphnia magna]
MLSKASLIFIAFASVTVKCIKHENLIIAVGDELEFLTDGSTYRTLTLDSYNASKLSALAYDATTRRLFFSDLRHRHGHIFSVSLDEEFRRPVEDIVERNNNETVESLAYDPVTKTLLWTDGLNRSIRRYQIDYEHVHIDEKEGIEIVHFLENDAKPQTLVSDPCTRMLYWTNIHNYRPSIERSLINGSQREILIYSDLLLPNAFDVDVVEQMIYWAEDLKDGHFRIQRSSVDGTGTQVFYHGIGNFIVSLTVGDHYVYWSDYSHKKLWSLRKDGSSKRPIILRTFRNPAMGVAVFRHQPLNCSLITSNVHHQELTMESTESLIVTLMILTSLTIVAAVAILIFRYGRLIGCAQPFLSNKTEGTFAFQNFQNPVPNNTYKMCERVI